MDNKIKILATGDWHSCSETKNQNKLRHSLDQMVDYLSKNPTDYLVHSGDMYEKLLMFKGNGGVDLVFEYLRKMARFVKYVVIVKGNEFHDPTGSISLLHKLEPNILAYEQPVILGFFKEKEETTYLDLLRSDYQKIAQESLQPEIIINMVPYPTKQAFITDQSIDVNNQNFGEVFDNLMIALGMVNNKFSCAKVMGFHGNVQGARLSNGQTLGQQDLIISPQSLLKAACNYYALSHVHMWQEILWNMIYSGNTGNRNWGETEQKSFQVVKFEDGQMEIERVLLKGTRPMIEVKAEFKNGKLVYDTEIPENAEVRVRCKITEDETNLLTDEKIEELTKQLGADKEVRFDPEVVPTQRESRSEIIMDAKTLEDEVAEYARITGYEVTKSILSKIDIIKQKAAETATVEE
ncbi:MAG: metallophosphoesterase family protein [Candidatus Aquicultor sp.]